VNDRSFTTLEPVREKANRSFGGNTGGC